MKWFELTIARLELSSAFALWLPYRLSVQSSQGNFYAMWLHVLFSIQMDVDQCSAHGQFSDKERLACINVQASC